MECARFTSLNFSAASGLLGFLSGWYLRASFLYVFLMSSAVAVFGKPRVWYNVSPAVDSFLLSIFELPMCCPTDVYTIPLPFRLQERTIRSEAKTFRGPCFGVCVNDSTLDQQICLVFFVVLPDFPAQPKLLRFLTHSTTRVVSGHDCSVTDSGMHHLLDRNFSTPQNLHAISNFLRVFFHSPPTLDGFQRALTLTINGGFFFLSSPQPEFCLRKHDKTPRLPFAFEQMLEENFSLPRREL